MKKHKTPAPRAQRGETLAEVLIALLIVALAALLLASMAAAASSVNTIARQKDEDFYAALDQVEAMDQDTHESGSIVIKAEGTTPPASMGPFTVDVYTSGELTLYKKQP